MRNGLVKTSLALLLWMCGETGWGQEALPNGTLTPANFTLYTYWLDGLVPSGAGAGLLYNGFKAVKGLDTIVEEDVAAGYQLSDFYRNPNGSPYTGPSENPTTFDQAEFLDDFGIRQGLLWNPQTKQNLLEAFLFYRAHFDHDYPTQGNPDALIFSSSLPDRIEIFSNAVQAGFAFNTVVRSKAHQTRNGVYAEASIEWAPSFFFNTDGDADYYRLNGTFQGFKTIYVAPSARGRNRFGIYLADSLEVDYAGGSSIPFYVFESFGGRNMRSDVDPTIRGFETGLYGADFKVLNNFDVRMTGPTVVVWKPFVPGLYTFLDTEYYDGYFDDPFNTPGGVLASTGFGCYLNFDDLVNGTIYIAFPFEGQRVDGAPVAPGAALSLLF